MGGNTVTSCTLSNQVCSRHYIDTFMFQQDNAPARCARETIQLLQRETVSLLICGCHTAPTYTRSTIKHHSSVCTVYELKWQLICIWRGLQLSTVDRQWSLCLRSLVTFRTITIELWTAVRGNLHLLVNKMCLTQ